MPKLREKPKADIDHMVNAMVDRMANEIANGVGCSVLDALTMLQKAVTLAVYRNGVHDGEQSLVRQYQAAERALSKPEL